MNIVCESLPAWRLISCPVVERPLEPLLAVGGVPRGPVANEGPEMLDKLIGRGEAADAEREEDPAPGMG